MKIKQLKEIIELYPDDLAVVINGDLGDYELSKDDIKCRELFIIWHSDYNNNNIPYISLSYEPQQGEYKYPNGNICKWYTKEKINCLILG